MRFQNKTALVTGATSGIGRATAISLAAEGATVGVAGRDKERGDAVVAEIRAAGGKAEFLPAELSAGAAAATALAEAAVRALGRVDILVNNAGVFPFGPTAETDEPTFDEVINVNVKTPFFLTAALAPAMAERRDGAIVNISTMVAAFGMPGMAVYGSSKATLESLTRHWAAEFGPQGVRVNAIAPGPTRTEGTVAMGEALDQLSAAAPAGRPGTAQEIADAVVYLASSEASFVHGVTLAVDGGRVAAS